MVMMTVLLLVPPRAEDKGELGKDNSCKQEFAKDNGGKDDRELGEDDKGKPDTDEEQLGEDNRDKDNKGEGNIQPNKNRGNQLKDKTVSQRGNYAVNFSDMQLEPNDFNYSPPKDYCGNYLSPKCQTL